MNYYPVAVLISVYKKDPLHQVEAAIESIRSQDYGNQSIRIYLGVDGPVPKELDAYIEKHSDHFYHVIRNETNQGLAATLNRLIDSLEDEKYAFRMDADDVALPFRFRLQAEYMDAHPAVDVCGGSIVEFDESGCAVMVRNYPENTSTARKYICKASPFAHMTVCFRRSLFENGKYRYPRVKSSQDIRLWHQVIADGKEVANLLVPLVLVRMNDSMLKRRSMMYGLREFGAFFRATYSLHGIGWRLIYPFARLMTRFTPSLVNRLIYRRFRQLLNPSKSQATPLEKNPIQCVGDALSDVDVTNVARRVLDELCGLSEEEVDRILLKPEPAVRHVA